MEDKLYDFEKSEKLLEEVDGFFKKEDFLKPIKRNEKTTFIKEEKTLISKFEIVPKDDILLESIDSLEDLEKVKTKFLKLSKEMLDKCQDILRNNNFDDENIKKAALAIFNSIKSFNQISLEKLFVGIQDDENIESNFIKKLSKLIKDKIINDCIEPIYQGLKHTQDNIYLKILNVINKFLSNIGISTLDIKINENINIYIDNLEILQEETTDYNLNDTIKEIVLYPYIFTDKKEFISEGKVISWRLKQ